MFTLAIPENYPHSRNITLVDSYGIDNVEVDKVSLQPYLETSFGFWYILISPQNKCMGYTGVSCLCVCLFTKHKYLQNP